jgi:hypothetical protein
MTYVILLAHASHKMADLAAVLPTLSSTFYLYSIAIGQLQINRHMGWFPSDKSFHKNIGITGVVRFVPYCPCHPADRRRNLIVVIQNQQS